MPQLWPAPEYIVSKVPSNPAFNTTGGAYQTCFRATVAHDEWVKTVANDPTPRRVKAAMFFF